MILETKYNIGDKIWFMSYRRKKVIKAPITAIEVTITDKTHIRYQITVDKVKSYFFEFQLFITEAEAIENCFQPILNV